MWVKSFVPTGGHAGSLNEVFVPTKGVIEAKERVGDSLTEVDDLLRPFGAPSADHGGVRDLQRPIDDRKCLM